MLKNRVENLRQRMKESHLDGVLLVSNNNTNYMTGFAGDDSFAIITLEKGIFITDSRYTTQAKLQVKEFEIRQYSGNIYKFISDIVKELDITKLGFEENVLTFKQYHSYEKQLSCELVPLNNMVETLRIIKDEDEINAIKTAASIADKAFDKILQFVKPGMTETEVAVELEYWLRKFKASGVSFSTIAASGDRSALPHGEPTEKVIKMGEFLTLDFGCIYNGYCSDMTRTIVMGEPTEKMKEVYNIVLEAQQKALKSYKPGIKASEVDKIARDHISSKGYGQYFGHSLGHGVGRYIHELPSVSPTSEFIFKPGMVVTDEPGIYIPDCFGVRIEDLVLITEDGCEILSKSPKNMIII